MAKTGAPHMTQEGEARRIAAVKAANAKRWTKKARAAFGAKKIRKAHGMHGSPTYRAWRNMLRRCFDEKYHAYHRYGGRGVKVHTPWVFSFEAFLADVGERPKGKELDRRDNSGHYEPGNVRWVTHKKNCRNKG